VLLGTLLVAAAALAQQGLIIEPGRRSNRSPHPPRPGVDPVNVNVPADDAVRALDNLALSAEERSPASIRSWRPELL
jgi:hypothetical protein